MKIDLHLAQNATLNAANQMGSAGWASCLTSCDFNDMQRGYIVQARAYLMEALDRLSAYQAKMETKNEAANG